MNRTEGKHLRMLSSYTSCEWACHVDKAKTSVPIKSLPYNLSCLPSVRFSLFFALGVTSLTLLISFWILLFCAALSRFFFFFIPFLVCLNCETDLSGVLQGFMMHSYCCVGSHLTVTHSKWFIRNLFLPFVWSVCACMHPCMEWNLWNLWDWAGCCFVFEMDFFLLYNVPRVVVFKNWNRLPVHV